MTERGPEIVVFQKEKSQQKTLAAYEHPWMIRITHWLSALSIFILIGSGLQIFLAFPSFGPKIPQRNLVEIPRAFHLFSPGSWIKAFSLGGWLAGGEMWHFTFMWIFLGCGVIYVLFLLFSGRYQSMLFTPRDAHGLWPMARYYFLFGTRPALHEQYNPLQKLAYTLVLLLAIVSVLSGLVLYNPVQFSWLALLMGGFYYARIWHFLAMGGFILFVIGHVIMVIIHGWKNFVSMLIGWKSDPEYMGQTDR